MQRSKYGQCANFANAQGSLNDLEIRGAEGSEICGCLSTPRLQGADPSRSWTLSPGQMRDHTMPCSDAYWARVNCPPAQRLRQC